MKKMLNKQYVKLCPATKEDYKVVQNMFQYYVYDMAGYIGRQLGWKLEEDGLYELIPSLILYWQEEGRYPFLIRVKEELAGFVLINKQGSTPDVDWNIGEFFIMKPFQRLGLGQMIAELCFDTFKGNWQVMVIPGNIGAYQFWQKTIAHYTQGNFTESLQKLALKGNEERYLFQFFSKAESST